MGPNGVHYSEVLLYNESIIALLCDLESENSHALVVQEAIHWSLYGQLELYSGASLQGTNWGVVPWREVVLFSEVLAITIVEIQGNCNLSF